jgi:hypothetical protein
MTAAGIGHLICRASTPESRGRRRAFLDTLTATAPIHPVTEASCRRRSSKESLTLIFSVS